MGTRFKHLGQLQNEILSAPHFRKGGSWQAKKARRSKTIITPTPDRNLPELPASLAGHRHLSCLPYGLLPTGDFYKQYKTAKLKPGYIKNDRPSEVKKALIVDDDTGLLGSLGKTVEQIIGARVLKVDPKSSVSINEQVSDLVLLEKPDLIFMDGDLGKLDTGEKLFGTQIVEQLRAKGFSGYIVAISSDPVLNWEMEDAGADFTTIEEFSAQSKEDSLIGFLNKTFLIGENNYGCE